MKNHSLKCLAIRLVTVMALVMVTANIASAQAQYANYVRQQLNFIGATLEENGFDKTHEYRVDRLSSNRTTTIPLTLRKGFEYILVSVCDQDCSDVDIRIYDENNNQIASDTKVDDIPLVTVSPRWTGEFRIQVKMYTCRNSPCYYGVGVYGR